MTVITTRSKPRLNRADRNIPMNSQHSVRAYRQSPEDICLQIRREKDYVSVSLTFDEARELIRVLEEELPLG